MENLYPEVLLRSRKHRTTITELVVSRLTLLTMLNMSGCNITNQGADRIALVLSETISLENLDLSDTNLNSAKAIKINDVLKNIVSLKVFSMNNNNITDGATDSVAAVILNNSSLEKVNISHNKLSYTGVLKIAKNLSVSGNIKIFDISNNFIKSDNVTDLTATLSKYPALQELNMSQNLLSLTNVLTIAQCFRHHSTLQTLNLSGNVDSFCTACEFIVDVILSVNQPLVNLNMCGRNIRPRYGEDYLSPPTNEDNSTKLPLQSLYLLQQNLLDVQTNVIKVSEICPLSNEDVISYYVDHLGGIFYNEYHNFALVIPPGAVLQGDCVEIQATANYFGPYTIPTGFYPISSYFWVSANYRFKAPVYLIMNHYAKIRSSDDVCSLHVLQATVRNSTEKPMMTSTSCGVYFDNEIRVCVLATDHYCSYCQAKDITNAPEYLIACYCTFDDPVSGLHIAEVCFCPVNTHCKKVINFIQNS